MLNPYLHLALFMLAVAHYRNTLSILTVVHINFSIVILLYPLHVHIGTPIYYV